MKDYFIFDESPCYPGKYKVILGREGLPFKSPVVGSYGVFAARLLGLSWTDYLRYCRDVWDAELVGRNSTYVLAYFPMNEKSEKFRKMLNERLNLILTTK